MSKPALRVAPPNKFDYDVSERVVRALQDSSLHVFTFNCLSGDPDQPDNSKACIVLTVTAVTDGTRGFLVMTDDYAAPRSDDEFTEFMTEVYGGVAPGGEYMTAVATFCGCDRHTRGILDLTDAGTARSVIESAYERAFEGKGAIDHAALFEHFARLGVKADDEEAARERCRDLDSIG